MTTRSSTYLHLLQENHPGNECSYLTGSKLPTFKEVLMCFLSNMEIVKNNIQLKIGKHAKHQAASAVADEVVKVYSKTRIPMVEKKSIINKILLFYNNEYLKFQRYSVEKMDANPKIIGFREKINQTMPFYTRNAEKIITDSMKGKSQVKKQIMQEELLFLQNMKKERTMIFGKKDTKCAVLEKNDIKRKAQEMIRIEKEAKRKKEQDFLTEETNVMVVENQVEEYTGSGPSSPKRRKHTRSVKTGCSAFWPPNVLQDPNLIQDAIRNNVTVNSLTNLARSFLRATNGDEQKVNLSYGYSYRYRKETAHNIADLIKLEWRPSPVLSLHWDGKLMATLDGTDKEERLPVLVSGIKGVKMLGVPVVEHKKGEKIGPKIAKASVGLLDSWECGNSIKAMVFDTTAANTGKITAACISIQEQLNKKLLWLPCRHHIGERILTHTWNSLKITEASGGPGNCLYSRFKQNFKLFKCTKLSFLSFPVIPPSLKDSRAEVVQLCQDFLSGDHNRGDYRELVVLTLVYLKKVPHEFKTFQRPGAYNHTRWMSKILYSLKMVLLGSQIQKLPEGTVFEEGTTRESLQKLTSFVQFVVFCYVPWWITSPNASCAPANDIKLIQSLQRYSTVHCDISEAARKAFNRHLWYLTEELAPLTLFNHSIDDATKEQLRKKLMNQKNSLPAETSRHGSGHGKPSFPNVEGLQHLDLSQLFGRESWQFFTILDVNTEFLYSPVSCWPSCESFLKAEAIVQSLHVVNDAAERGVKLCHDFIASAKSEMKLQNILQVVENSRSHLPNQRSNATNDNQDKKWFLKL